MTTLYGISNCDSVKKAKKWLSAKAIGFDFHDFRVDGLDRHRLSAWCQTVDYQQLLNNRSTTWRSLESADKSNLSQAKAIDLMVQHPTLIKRPVLEYDGGIAIGFKADDYEQYFL